MAQQSLVGHGLLIIEGSRSLADTPHLLELLWKSDQPDILHSQETAIHSPGGIQTRNPSKRAATDPRLRPHAHRARPLIYGIE
jgi:hypothetical protein